MILRGLYSCSYKVVFDSTWATRIKGKHQRRCRESYLSGSKVWENTMDEFLFFFNILHDWWIGLTPFAKSKMIQFTCENKVTGYE